MQGRHSRRRGRGPLVIANPSKGSSDEEEPRPAPSPAPVPNYRQQPPPLFRTTGSGNALPRSSQRSDVSSSRGDGRYRPSPIPTYDDKPPRTESSRSASTPPPVTPGQPGQHDPYVNDNADDAQQTLMPNGHSRHPSDAQYASSPRSPIIASLPPSSPLPAADKLLIMATTSEHFTVVDITGARSAEFIRERMFSRLQISDHDQHRYSIYRTVLGEYPPTPPHMSADDLLRVCLQEGDSKGSLKFLVVLATGRRLPPINTVTAVPPLPVPPTAGDGFSPSLVRSNRMRHRPAPSVSSASADRQAERGYLASESELDPPDRSRGLPRQLEHAHSNSPPSASTHDMSMSPRQYLPGLSTSSRHVHTASSSPTSASLLSASANNRSRFGSLTPTPGNGYDPDSVNVFKQQPLPPTPQQPGGSRQNSYEQEQADLNRLVHNRPSVPARKGSFRKGRSGLPNIPPPPTAPPPVPVGTPVSVPRPSPRPRGPGTPQSLANTPSGQAPSRVDIGWLQTGQASSKQQSPQHLKPTRSMDMLGTAYRSGSRSGTTQGETPTSPHPQPFQRGGEHVQSADPRAAGSVARGPGASRNGPAYAGRPAWSDTERAPLAGARVQITSPSQESLGSSSSDFERPPASPLSPADESTLKAEDREHYSKVLNWSNPPVLPPITTQESSLLPTNTNLGSTLSSSWGDDDDTIWVHPPSIAPSLPSAALPPPPPPPPFPAFVPPENEEDSIWYKPPPVMQPPQPQRITVQIDEPAPTSSTHSPTESSPKQPRASKPRPQSRFINRESVTWNVRPSAQEMYEHLEEFFPEHDLDKPLLDTAGGGDSPATPVSATAAQPSPLTRGGVKHRKTIRHVAREGKKILDRTSKIESPAAAMARKRSTKLWGTKVEEVTPGTGRNGPPSAVPESPNSTTAKPVTRWIKGDLIGKGTYGKVFLALNANTGEMIAVKQVELPKTVSDMADKRQIIVVEAIKSESTTLRDLDHPNVVQYLGFEETGDYFNLFLEYVPGGSIGGILRKLGKFDEEVAKMFTHQILCGLEYLHSRGIWHRDLKGDNILVDPSGICKITDFGISKRNEDVESFDSSATNMQGSIFWMAPEVLSNAGQGYNVKIDIWSLGCVYVEMMTGRRPWENENFVAVMYILSTKKEAPPLPQLSDIGQEFVSQCFEKDPNMRPTAAVLRTHAYLVPRPGWVFNGSFVPS